MSLSTTAELSWPLKDLALLCMHDVQGCMCGGQTVTL